MAAATDVMSGWALLLAATLQHGPVGAPSAYPPGYGPMPALPAPEHGLLPTLNTAPVVPWPPDTVPQAPPGFAVQAYARGLVHPRWLYVLPNGDVLVAEAGAPARPPEGGIKDAVMRHAMKKAGAGGASADRITLLRGVDASGAARTRSTFLTQLHSPFGMALTGGYLYVANTDAVLRFPYRDGQTSLPIDSGVKVMDLPAGPPNMHWTRNLLASPDGKFLYVTVGSNSNVGERGLELEGGRAAIWQLDLSNHKARVYASGLRNPNGLAWQGQTLWTTVNERDELGDDLVPDFLTSVRDGGFYGWPWSYFGPHPDRRVRPARPDQVAQAQVPDYGLGAHTASLGLAFYEATLFPPTYRGGAFIGQHGSWNRRKPSGYKVIFIPFRDGSPAGPPRDFLTGFLDADGKARGRPVGVAVDRGGALLLADDVGNTIWRVTPAPPAAGAAAPP